MTKDFNQEAKNEIEVLMKDKDISDEDKKNLGDIILSVYLKKRDRVGEKKAKKLEVEEYIKTL